MPTNRRRLRRQERQTISQAAVEAFRGGDWMELHRALGLKPWEPSPLDTHSEECPYSQLSNAYSEAWPKVWALRRALEDAAAERDA